MPDERESNNEILRVRVPKSLKRRAKKVAVVRMCDVADLVREALSERLKDEEGRLGLSAEMEPENSNA